MCAAAVAMIRDFNSSCTSTFAPIQSLHFTLMKTEIYFSEAKMASSSRYIGQLTHNININ